MKREQSGADRRTPKNPVSQGSERQRRSSQAKVCHCRKASGRASSEEEVVCVSRLAGASLFGVRRYAPHCLSSCADIDSAHAGLAAQSRASPRRCRRFHRYCGDVPPGTAVSFRETADLPVRISAAFCRISRLETPGVGRLSQSLSFRRDISGKGGDAAAVDSRAPLRHGREDQSRGRSGKAQSVVSILGIEAHFSEIVSRAIELRAFQCRASRAGTAGRGV